MEIAWLPEPERHPLWTEILRLLERGVFSPQAVIDTNDWVWIIYDGPVLRAAATTRLHEDGEACLLLAGGHRFQEWIGLLDETVAKWARSGGANRLTMRGRRGWERFAKRFGWRALGLDDDGLIQFQKDIG